MRALSFETFKILVHDSFMKVCCLEDETCQGRVQFHHNLIIAGSQSDEPKTILPVCELHHQAAQHTEVKERLDLIMFQRLTLDELQELVPKTYDIYKQRIIYLNKKYSVEKTNDFFKISIT